MADEKYKYLPYKTKLKTLARENRNEMTAAENKMWYEVLARKQCSGYKFTRQKPVDNFILDFYCAKLLLAIEVDGDSHADKKEYDDWRTEQLVVFGIKVIRFDNDYVLNQIEELKMELEKQIKVREKEF